MKRRKTIWLLAVFLLASLSTSAAAKGAVERYQSEWDFMAPSALLLETDGTMLVADAERHNIVQLFEQQGTLIAGYTLPLDSFGIPAGSYLDGPVQTALFHSPAALVHWGDGLVVSDQENHCLRLIVDDTVRTLTGGQKGEGLKNGAAATARFSAPMGLAVDESGVLYIADSGNGCVRALSEKGRVSTYVSGLEEPVGLCWQAGVLYIADIGTHQILQYKDGQLSVLAGRFDTIDDVAVGGFRDGAADQAEFLTPFALAVDGDTIYVADTGNSAIRKIQNGWVSTLASYDGRDGDIWPASPVGLQLQGETLYVADRFAGCVLCVDIGVQLFDDVPAESWFAPSVSCLYTEGMMRGTTANRFSPQATITRGQLAVMLHRLEGQPEASPAVFSDMSRSRYDDKAVNWATQAGIVAGFPDGTFRPNAPITRQELTTLLHRYAQSKGPLTGSADTSSYTDHTAVAEYAREAMGWAVGNGLIQGDGRSLQPAAWATRSQAAAILTRFLLLP